jgi:hypothetical protein
MSFVIQKIGQVKLARENLVNIFSNNTVGELRSDYPHQNSNSQA